MRQDGSAAARWRVNAAVVPLEFEPGHDGDVARGEANARVGRLDARVVPAPDRPRKNVRIHIARKPNLAAHARDIVGQHDRSGGDRHGCRARLHLGRFAVRQDLVAPGEIDGLGNEALHALARPDDVIGDRHVSVRGLIDGDPLLVERGREGGARSVQRHGRGHRRCAALRPARCDRRRNRQGDGGCDHSRGLSEGHGLAPIRNQLNLPLIYSLVSCSRGSLKTWSVSPISTR